MPESWPGVDAVWDSMFGGEGDALCDGLCAFQTFLSVSTQGYHPFSFRSGAWVGFHVSVFRGVWYPLVRLRVGEAQCAAWSSSQRRWCRC